MVWLIVGLFRVTTRLEETIGRDVVEMYLVSVLLVFMVRDDVRWKDIGV